jgi:hypothetical protein
MIFQKKTTDRKRSDQSLRRKSDEKVLGVDKFRMQIACQFLTLLFIRVKKY